MLHTTSFLPHEDNIQLKIPKKRFYYLEVISLVKKYAEQPPDYSAFKFYIYIT